MSTPLEIRQRQRERERKQRFKRNILLFVLLIIIIIFFSLCVKGIFSKISKNRAEDAEFIFNGYVYPELPVKNTDVLVDALKADGKKTAYLTFDDGPTKAVTPRILDILRRYDAKATFFMCGAMIEANPDMARRVYDEGHFIANHSYSHQYSELYADGASFMNEINRTNDLIAKVTEKNNYPKVFRFPGGGYDAGTYGPAKQEYKKLLEENGIRFCDWNALNGDAETRVPDPDTLVSRLMATTKDKEDVVILMHDAAAKAATADALARICEYLVSQGYEFDTLDHV